MLIRWCQRQLERESHTRGAGDFYVPLSAALRTLAVSRISRILLYASNHTSALVVSICPFYRKRICSDDNACRACI